MKNNKDYNYFEAFIDLSSYSLKAAEILNKTLQEFNPKKIEEKIIEMHTVEHSADVAKHELLHRLAKEFLPPIEREDIMSLSQTIDDVTDAIEDVLVCFDIFNIQSVRPEIHKFTELIMKCCKYVDGALAEFHNFKKSKKLKSIIIEINALEEQGDALYVNGVRNLYKTSKEPLEIMVWTEIFERLERCFDACEDVADHIENVVMKNS